MNIPDANVGKFVEGLSPQQAYALLHDWENLRARPEQLPPFGDWEIWLIMSGRGWGKTRTGAEWVRKKVATGDHRHIALVAETAADARDVMVEGESGLLEIHPKHERPRYEPSNRKLTWPNGTIAHTYNATEPDQLRGPQHDLAWADELAKWAKARETWDQLQFGLRKGENPQQIITTTPRPIKLLKDIIAGKEGEAVVTEGHTLDNKDNLSAKFLRKIQRKYEGTRLGRQELAGKLLSDAPNALWTQANIDENRVSNIPAKLGRVVVAVDPPSKDGDLLAEDDDAGWCGITVCAVSENGELGFLLEDGSIQGSPRRWGRRVVSLHDKYSADAIVAEINNGGAMVKATIRSVRSTVRVIEVTATRGKHIRAEPISSIYEQDRISHVGTFAQLEDQLTSMTTTGYLGDGSPDRLDALVWGFTELFDDMVEAGAQDIPEWKPRAVI